MAELSINDAVGAVLGEDRSATAAQARNNLSFSLDANPDKEAQYRRTARTLGLPVESVRNEPQLATTQATLQGFDAERAAQDYPHLAKFLAGSVDNTRLVHDDLGPLAHTEGAARTVATATQRPVANYNDSPKSVIAQAVDYIFSTPTARDSLLSDASTLRRGLASHLAGTGKYLSLASSTLVTPADAAFNTNMRGDAFELTRRLDEYAKESALGPDAPLKDKILHGVGSAGGMLIEAALTGGTVTVARAGASLFEALAPALRHGVQAMMVPSAVAARDVYDQALATTGDVKQAVQASMGTYVSSTLGGVVPFATPGKLAYRSATGAVSGAITGQVNRQAAGLYMPDALQPPPTSADDVIVDSVMGVMFGAMAGPRDLADFNGSMYKAARQTYVDAARAAEAIKAGDALQTLSQATTLGKLRDRDQGAFKQFVQDVAADGEAPDVFIDGKTFTEALAQSGLTPDDVRQVLPEVASQMQEASQIGGDVRIPLADYAAHIAGSEIEAGILPHVKIDPEGPTYTEAQQIIKDQGQRMGELVDKLVADQGEQSALREQRKVVFDDVLGQLEALGRFTPDVNQAYATLVSNFYTTMAHRLGVDTTELLQRYPLQVRGERVDGFDQALATQPPKGWQHATDGTAASQLWGGEAEHDAVFWTDLGGKLSDDAPSVAGYSHSINKSAAQHIRNRHGDAEAESQRGQLPVTEADLSKIPEIVTSYDAVRTDLKGNHGEQMVAYAKKAEDGVLLYLEAVTKKRQNMGAVSMWKYPPTADVKQVLEHAVSPGHYVHDEVAASKDDSTGGVFNQAKTPDLVVQHNLSAEKLLHAKKMGGLAVPSLAITKGAHPLTGFGEITLLGDKDLADPKGYAKTKVFGADVYSPRYPKFSHDINFKAFNKIVGDFTPFAKKMGQRGSGIDFDELAQRGPAELARNPVVMAKFLADKGIEPKIVMREGLPAERLERLKKFGLADYIKGTADKFELIQDPDFVRKVIDEAVAGYKEIGEDKRGGLIKKLQSDEDAQRNYARATADEILRERSQREQPEADRYATINALEAQLKEAGLDREFAKSNEALVASISKGERIFQGWTNSGNKRYIPHTLDNVVKILKKELRGGEGFDYGVGSLRARFTPEFRSLEAIRKSESKLITAAEFDAVRTEINNEFDQLRNEIAKDPDNVRVGSETLNGLLADAPKIGLERAAKQYSVVLSPENKQAAVDFLNKLRELPTAYFEAKILRSVDPAEFKGAVVPHDVDPEVLEYLQARGVTDIRTYQRGSDTDRAAKIGEFSDLFFQGNRGAYDPVTRTIALLKTADLSTFLHETGHHFLEMMGDIAARPDAPPQVVADFNTLLADFGVRDSNEWHMMSLEEKRAHHEKFAESFERYLMEGKAPSVELAGLFQRFKSWMLSVYKSLANMRFELTPEVRQVMDRMLASEEAIKDAEAIQGFQPLFKSAEDAGMAPEQFAEYLRLGQESTDAAMEYLQAASMRDMKWLSGARSRALKALQAEAKLRRTELEMQVRGEVMVAPVYQAWQFLTGKASPLMREPTAEEIKAQTAYEAARDEHSKQRTEATDVAREKLKNDLWEQSEEAKATYPSPQARGLAKGRWLSSNRKAVELEVDRAAKAWDKEHPAPEAPPAPVADVPDAEFFGKLDVKGMEGLGIPRPITDHLRTLKMTAKEGMHPDMVAARFGFSSGDELVRTLAAAQHPKDVIQGMTDQRMLERYGELASPDALEREAMSAVHNEARARFVATELRTLAKANSPDRMIAAAAREAAKASVAIKRIRDLNVGQYTRAEANAAKAAQRALAKGDARAAATEKRAQLLANTLVRQVRDAITEAQKTLDYFRSFDKPKDSLDRGYQEQIDMLLAKYDLKPRSGRAIDETKRLRDWVQARLNAGEVPVISEALLTPAERKEFAAQIKSRDEEGNLLYADPEEQIKLLADAIERSAQRSFKDLTVEEMRGLRDTIRQIEHLGKLKNKLLTAKDNKTYAETRDALVAAVQDNATSDGKNVRTSNTWVGQRLEALRQFGTAHIKVANWLRKFDGGEDNGIWWRTIIRPANERATWETTRRAESTRALVNIIKPVLDKVPALDKVGSGRFFHELGTSLNWQERIAFALNYGNESNLQRLMGGGIAGVRRELSQNQIMAVLKTLSAAEWNMVQQIWDHMESYRPEIAAKELRVSGVEPAWVDARPFRVMSSDGQPMDLRGGYYPVVYDPRTSLKAEQHADSAAAKDAMKAAFSAATTRRSFTKDRVEEVTGRPLMLNLQGLYRGVGDVIHDLAWHEWLIDVNKLMRSSAIDEAIREHYGADVKREITKWRDDIVAANQGPQTVAEKTLAYTRRFVSASALTFNALSGLMQLTGITQSAARIGYKWVGLGVLDFVRNPIDTVREVRVQSEFMANRSRTFHRDLNELRNIVSGQTAAGEVMAKYGYAFMSFMQSMVDVPTWVGAREKALAQGLDEGTAIALADQAVKDSQGGGEAVDQSGIARGNAAVKLFTAFYEFMNTQANVIYMAGTNSNSRAEAFMHLMMVAAFTPIASAALRDAMQPGDTGSWDDNKIVGKMAAEVVSNLFGMVAFGRELTAAATALVGEGRDYSGPAGVRPFVDAYKLAVQAHQGELDDAFRKAFINVMGDLFGVPAVQINRSITGAKAMSEGQTDNPAALLMGHQERH